MTGPPPGWRTDPATGERLRPGTLTRAELAAWLAAVARRHAGAPEPPVLYRGDDACRRCGGRGKADARWIGWMTCGACGGSGVGPPGGHGRHRGARST